MLSKPFLLGKGFGMGELRLERTKFSSPYGSIHQPPIPLSLHTEPTPNGLPQSYSS